MDKYIEQLKPLFEKVAEKIGQGAQFGWEVVLRQQISYGLIGIFFSILGLTLFIGGYKTKVTSEDWEYGNGVCFLKVTLIIVGLISFIWGTLAAILYLTNPSYYALQFFINLAK